MTSSDASGPGMVILFGSGEMSPTGRTIHEAVFKKLGWKGPVRIGILETPTGFEVNAKHGWPERLEEFFRNGLQNYKPFITRIRAWRRDGEHSTNDATIVDAILDNDYIYCGAGSPGYTIRHLEQTRAYENLRTAHTQGSVLCLGSATAIAVSAYALPVYEIFKAGEDLHWVKGLDLLGVYGLSLTIVPHWNNAEGEDFDTTYSWMGQERFMKLHALLPQDTTILGIDEQTACLFDFREKTVRVMGIGAAHIWRNEQKKDIPTGTAFSFEELR